MRSYYGYDGQGSVRFLMDSNGNVADQYTYSSFGETLFKSGPTDNVNLYDGEKQDGNTGFYNLRARWMNPGVGRFQSMDSFDGDEEDPLSLHRYLFVADDPMDKIDPLGQSLTPIVPGLTPEHKPLAGGVGALLKVQKLTDLIPGISISPGETAIQRGSGLVGTVGYFAEYQGHSGGDLIVPLLPKPGKLDCTEFISYCFQTPIYRTFEFDNNPYFSQVDSPERGDVLIWQARKPKKVDAKHPAYQGHAAIYTGLGGGHAILHSSGSRGVAETNDFVAGYYKNTLKYKNVDEKFYRNIESGLSARE